MPITGIGCNVFSVTQTLRKGSEVDIVAAKDLATSPAASYAKIKQQFSQATLVERRTIVDKGNDLMLSSSVSADSVKVADTILG